MDANGDVRKTEYKAGPDGFQPSGDIGVDKKTAEKAAELAALAPKAPVEEKVEIKVPSPPFTVPFYATVAGLNTPIAGALPLPYAQHPLALPLAYATPFHFNFPLQL